MSKQSRRLNKRRSCFYVRPEFVVRLHIDTSSFEAALKHTGEQLDRVLRPGRALQRDADRWAGNARRWKH